jgi:cell division protease FtsH
MVSFFGMSEKVGNISFYDSSGQSDFGFTKPYSEKTAELIDQEVKGIIDESYVRARDVLQNNMKGLTELAEILLEKEVIFSEDLEKIFGKRKADLIKEAQDSVDKSATDAALKEKKGKGKKTEGTVKAAEDNHTEGSEKEEKEHDGESGKKELKKSKTKDK